MEFVGGTCLPRHLFLGALAMTIWIPSAWAQQDVRLWQGYAHCKSKSPAGTARRSCNDVRSVAVFPAQSGIVIDLASIKVWEGRNVHWSQKSCQVVLSNYVEVIPGTGVMLPTRLTMNAVGRSDASTHHMDLECHVTVQYGPFAKLGTASAQQRQR